MIFYLANIYNYIVNVFKNLMYSDMTNDTNTLKIEYNKNNEDLFKELSNSEKKIINEYRFDLKRFNDLLDINEYDLFSRLLKLNDSFNRETPLRIIIHSLTKKKESIYDMYNFKDNLDLSVELIQFNSEILFLQEKFLILEKIKNTEEKMQNYLNSIVIK